MLSKLIVPNYKPQVNNQKIVKPEKKIFERVNSILANEHLSCQEKMVAVAYFFHGFKQGHAWPSVETVQKETSLSKPTVIKHLKKLCKLGLIKKVSLDPSYAKCIGKLGRTQAYRVF